MIPETPEFVCAALRVGAMVETQRAAADLIESLLREIEELKEHGVKEH